MATARSNFWMGPVLVGGSLTEAFLLSLTSWGALILPGLCSLVLALLQPGALVLGILALRPTLDIWQNVSWAIPGSVHQRLNINALVGLAIMGSLVFNMFRANVEPRRLAHVEIRRDPIFTNWIIFLTYILFVSLVFSPDVNGSLMELIRFVSVPAIYWLAKKFVPTDSKRVLTALNLILLSSLAPVAYGLFQFVSGKGGWTEGGIHRVMSFMINPVVFSQYLSQIVVAGVLLVLYHRKGVKRVTTLVILGAALFAQGVTYGKGGWVGTMVGLLMVGLIYQGKKIKVRGFLVPLLVLLVLGTILVNTLPGVSKYLAQWWGGTTAEESSLISRILLWRVGWSAFLDSPVFGHGLGSAMIIVQRAWGFPLELHSDYLRLVVESGLLGLAMYVAIHVHLLRLIFRATARLIERDPLFKFLIAATLAVEVAYLVMITVDNLVTSLLANYPIWILAGMVRGFYEQSYKGEPVEADPYPAPPAPEKALSS